MSSGQIVLPDTLVAQLIGNAADLSGHLHNDFTQLTALRADVRQKLLEEKKIVKVNVSDRLFSATHTIDGAHLPEIDRASAYSVSCAVCVGKDQSENDQSSCLAILPHVPSINSLSGGLMMMQEIMMAVRSVEDDPECVCFIDGSKISAIISINQFYAGILSDLPDQLNQWRALGAKEDTREPGRTLRLFESRDWITTYLTSPNIVGNLKLVTTDRLIRKYTPSLIGRFDDKTLASLILDPGEAITPQPLDKPGEPYHISDRGFPYSKNLSKIEYTLYNPGDNLIQHIYYRPDKTHSVFKIEVTDKFIRDGKTDQLFAWWIKEIAAPDLQEPYSYFIADRFAKEAVSVAKKALQEITRRDSQAWNWYFTQPYRTVR